MSYGNTFDAQMLQHRLSILIMFQKVMRKVILMHDAPLSHFQPAPNILDSH
jgi:hypothetical protein